MFDHIGFRVADLGRARRFYQAVTARSDTSFLVVKSADAPIPFLWVGTEQPAFWKDAHRVSASPIHLAFPVKSEAAVKAFYDAGLEAGGTDNGPPGPRGPAEMAYYAAFLLDPDGNNVEAGWRRGG